MNPEIKNTYNLRLLIFCIFALIGVQDAYSQCPTITNSTQSFCDLDEPTVADLIATDGGNGIVWYETATSTIPLDDTDGLENGEDYFADDATGSCGVRESVTITIYGAPTGFNFQGVCVENPNEATISDLEAFGNDVQWYDVSEGGTPLSGTTLVVDDTIYYADQANPDTGCRTSRLSVLVNIGIVPVPTGNPIQEFCSADVPTIADLVASGNNNWYDSLSSVVPLDPSTPLINGMSYFATTVDPPCESSMRFEVTVQLSLAPDPGLSGNLDFCATGSPQDLFDALGGTPEPGGTWSPTLASGTGVFDPTVDTAQVYTYTVSGTPPCGDDTATVTVAILPDPNAGTNGHLDFCENDSPQDLFNALGGTPDSGGVWSPALASGTGVFDPAVDTAQVYTYTVSGTGSCDDATATVTVTIALEPNPGLNGTLDICTNNSPVNLFDALGGTPEPGGIWSPALASGTGVFDPAVDTAQVYTYTVSGTPPCGDASATVTVAILPEPNAGTDGNLDFCSNDSPQDLFNALGGAPETGGVWSPALASGTGVFDPAVDTAQVYTYTVSGTGSCDDATATVTVTIALELDPGLNGTLDICNNSSPVDLFDALGGTPEPGGTWSPALASGTGVFDPSVDTAQVYTYTLSGTPPCGDASATVSVTILPDPNAGTDGNLDICSNDSPQDLFNALGGTPDSGGVWSPALASGTGVFDPAIDTAQVYTYTVSGTGSCDDATATVTVTITLEPNPGLNGALDICNNSSPVDLFDALGGTPEPGGTWSPALASGTGVFDPSVDTAQVYTYTLSGTLPCGDVSATVSVALIPEPNAGIDADGTVCIADGPQDLINFLDGSPDPGGTWTPTLTSGTGVFDPTSDSEGTYTYTVSGPLQCGQTATSEVTVTIAENPNLSRMILELNSVCLGEDIAVMASNANLVPDGDYMLTYILSEANDIEQTIEVNFVGGATSFIIPASLLINSGNTTLTLTDFFASTTLCGADTTVIDPIVFTILDSPTPSLIEDGNLFCTSDNATISNLSDNIIDSGTIIWYDALSGGNAYDNEQKLDDGQTYYASLTTADGCTSLIRLAVTVTIEICEEFLIPDGFSPNGDGINDTFYIPNLRMLYPDYDLEIFNRYGNVLYKGNKKHIDWDGRNNGNKEAPVGVYFYILKFNDGTRDPIQGRVYLNR